MSAAAPRAAAPGLPHAPARPDRRWQRVRVPWRLVASPHYPDAALAVYLKVAALAARPEGCTASVTRLATYLGTSKSTVERGLRPLTQPDPDTGQPEMTTRRRTQKGTGDGQTAERRVRPRDESEPWVWLPVHACEVLTPRQLRAYAVLAYCRARGIPLTEAELAGYLLHHTGRHAGQPVDERTASTIIDQLDALGWITLHRRQGHRGRHAWDVHHHPLHLVPNPTPETSDGSGPDLGDGSLAYKEDHWTDRPEHEPPAVGPSAVGETPVGKAPGPVENPPAAPAPVDNPAERGTGPGLGYAGPQLTISARVWQVLEPVRHLYAASTVWEQRAIAREAGRQLDAGCDPRRLRLRLQGRYARTWTLDITQPGRWLLGAALPRWGCPNPDCESGVRWPTDVPCEMCAELAADRRRRRREQLPEPEPPDPAPGPRPTWHECRDCRAPSRTPLPAGRCAPCHRTTTTARTA